MQENPLNSFSSRLYRAVGPLLGGLLLDLVDLATFGPMGIMFGWLLGGLTGYWIGTFYQISPKTKWLLAFLGAIYCTIPGTAFIPIATIVSVFCRFFENPQQISDNCERKQIQSEVIKDQNPPETQD